MNLNKLKEFPTRNLLIIITVLSFLTYIFMTIVIFAPIEADLKGSTGYGVMEFELAWTSENINKIFSAWGQDGKNKQLFVTIVDFFYIPSYGFFMGGCILLISRKLEGKIQEIGLYMTLIPFIAGAFDVIENINLILMLTYDSYIWSLSPFIASLCATIKFGLLMVAIIFFIISIIYLIIKKLK
jgi:hypothetical protein